MTLETTGIRGLAQGYRPITVAYSGIKVLETWLISNNRQGSSWRPRTLIVIAMLSKSKVDVFNEWKKKEDIPKDFGAFIWYTVHAE